MRVAYEMTTTARTTMNACATAPISIDCPPQQLRMKVAFARTTVIGDDVYDKVTGEYHGCYIRSQFSPEPFVENPGKPSSIKSGWTIAEDGTPLPPASDQSEPYYLAPVVQLFSAEHIQRAEQTPQLGRRPQVINNPLASALLILELEKWPTPWLDDIVFGASCTGPGIINGKHSVSHADVKKVLRHSELSVAAAASLLLNHDRMPMETRQLQRVVQAARVALRGIALHLERHPDILRRIDVAVELDNFWEVLAAQPISAHSTQHPKKEQALLKISSGIPIKTIARELGISKNTVKNWGCIA